MKENIKDNSTAVATAAPAPATLAEAREALAQQARQLARLSFLVEASKILNSTLDLPELLGLILKMAQENTGADRGSLFLVDHERQEIWSLLAHGLEQKEIRLPMGKGIAGAVAATGDIVNLADAYTDPRFDRDFDQRFGYRTKALLCLPITDRDDKTVGVLQLLNKRDGNFDAEDVDFLQSLSVHSAIALENARLHRESLERQRMEREMALARSIQLEPGDVILACTDGITEAANAAGDQFETERMVAAAREHRQKPAQDIVEAIVAEVAAFERGGSHFDDKVMMALKLR